MPVQLVPLQLLRHPASLLRQFQDRAARDANQELSEAEPKWNLWPASKRGGANQRMVSHQSHVLASWQRFAL